jgi:hypothetical protein
MLGQNHEDCRPCPKCKENPSKSEEAMKPSFRAWFLIGVACVVLNLRWGSAVLFVGYALAEYFDQRQSKKESEEVVDDMLFGWKPSEDDKTFEDKGTLSRMRLTGVDQVLTARVAELLLRMR